MCDRVDRVSRWFDHIYFNGVRTIKYAVYFTVILLLLSGCGEDKGQSVPNQDDVVLAEKVGTMAQTQGFIELKSGWKMVRDPVHTGQYGVASDPAILRETHGLSMYYTGLDPISNRTILCLAISKDGLHWTEAQTDVRLKGMVLDGHEGAWDENLETACVIRVGQEYWLYYSGYRDQGDPIKGFPASLGLATSTDGVVFQRHGGSPLLFPKEDGFDCHAIYSPVVVKTTTGFAMVYCGHAYAGKRVGVRLLGATSSDGIHWTRCSTPVLEGETIGPWTKDGVAEPALLYHQDAWWLFFTGLNGEQRVIGVAQGPSPFGPWEIRKTPILQPSDKAFADRQLLAPSVLVDPDRIRMWLLGIRMGNEEIQVGYAELGLR